MIYPLLPAFVTVALGAGPAFLGLVEGAAEAVASVLKVVAGHVSDRLPRRKPLVVAGYALSSLVRPLVALATAPTHVLLVRIADRIGKGVRGAPRDALLAEATLPASAAARSASTARWTMPARWWGRCWPPPLLWFRPDVRLVFALAAVPAALSVAVLVFGVREEPRAAAPRPGTAAAERVAARRADHPLPGRAGAVHARQLVRRVPAAASAGARRAPARHPRPMGVPPCDQGGCGHARRHAVRPLWSARHDRVRLGGLRGGVRRVRGRARPLALLGPLRRLRALPRPHGRRRARPGRGPQPRRRPRPRLRALPRGHRRHAAAGEPASPERSGSGAEGAWRWGSAPRSRSRRRRRWSWPYRGLQRDGGPDDARRTSRYSAASAAPRWIRCGGRPVSPPLRRASSLRCP